MYMYITCAVTEIVNVTQLDYNIIILLFPPPAFYVVYFLLCESNVHQNVLFMHNQLLSVLLLSVIRLSSYVEQLGFH